ncbi:F166A protein, partial [Anseranas semipalmata]|nr:F166A protein [Anseranas semipalmata]
MTAPRESSLFPPDPYHVPGYEGFVPQYNYQFGETYGKTTYRLLTDPHVRKSPHPVLAPLRKQRFIEDFSGTQCGLQPYLPGHPGEQPPIFTTTSVGSVTEQRVGAEGRCDGDAPASPFPHLGLCPAGYFPYERAGAMTSFPEPVFGPKPPPPGPAEEQLLLTHEDPTSWHGPGVTEAADVERADQLPKLDVPNVIQQKVISGYTGYIPRFTWITGVNYLQGVKEAMAEFDRHQFLQRNPIHSFGKRFPQTYWPNNRIYTSAGLIPSYTGFVPHLRHTYALTFGNSTRKAYQKEQRRR